LTSPARTKVFPVAVPVSKSAMYSLRTAAVSSSAAYKN